MKKRVFAIIAMVLVLSLLVACQAEDDKSESKHKKSKKDKKETTQEADEASLEDLLKSIESKGKKDEEIDPVEEPTATPETVEEKTKTNSGPIEMSDDIFSYQIGIDGVVYQFPTYVSTFEENGWIANEDANTSDINGTLAPNYHNIYWYEKGDDTIILEISNMDINEKPVRECVVTGIQCEKSYHRITNSEKFIVPGNIPWDSANYDTIINSFGTPSRENDTESLIFVTYSEDIYNSVEFIFYADDSTLYVVNIDNYEVPEDFVQGEISTEDVPKVVEAYVPATKMSDKPEDFTFELAGDYYKLPCPTQVFIDNGWEVVEDKSESFLEGYGYGKVVLRKDNSEFSTYAVNYDANAVPINYSFVEYCKIDTLTNNTEITILAGVQREDKLEDVKKKLEPLGFEFTTEDSGYTYGKFNYDTSKAITLYFNKEGNILYIEVANCFKRTQYASEMGIE